MRRALAIVALLLACSREAPPLPPGAIEICEPCVGTLGEYSIGVGNIWERELPGADGVLKKRPSAMLAIWRNGDDAGATRDVIVAPGSEVQLGDETYRVIDVDVPPGKPGSVRLQKK